MNIFDELKQQEQLNKEIALIFNEFGAFLADCAQEAVDDASKYCIGYREAYKYQYIEAHQIHITYEYCDPWEDIGDTTTTLTVPCEWLMLYTEDKLEELKQRVMIAEKEHFDKKWELHRSCCKQAAEACGFIVKEK